MVINNLIVNDEGTLDVSAADIGDEPSQSMASTSNNDDPINFDSTRYPRRTYRPPQHYDDYVRH